MSLISFIFQFCFGIFGSYPVSFSLSASIIKNIYVRIFRVNKNFLFLMCMWISISLYVSLFRFVDLL
jgi:hypothetical protein